MSDSEKVFLNVDESAEEYTDDVLLANGNNAVNDEDDDLQEDNSDDNAEDGRDVGNDADDDIDMEASAVGEEEDHATRTFDKHTDIVYCVKVEPVSSRIAVTGGKDDTAYVWNVNSGEVLHQSERSDTVTCVGFSFDGRYLAIGDMSGLIEVIKISDMGLVCTYKTDDIEWMKWHHSAHVLMTGNSDGTVYIRNVPGDQCKVFPAGEVPVMTGLFLPDGVRACSGDGNGVIKVWDVKNSTCLHTIPVGDSAVVCMDTHPDNVLVITGSEDSKARLINSQNGKIIETFQCGTTQEDPDAVEAVGFSPSSPLVATGTLSGALSIWDIRSCVQRETCAHPKGVVKLVWEKERPMFYTACLDGILRLWDARIGQAVSSWKGHRDSIMDFDISRDGSLVVCTSSDNTARVFSTHHPQPT